MVSGLGWRVRGDGNSERRLPPESSRPRPGQPAPAAVRAGSRRSEPFVAGRCELRRWFRRRTRRCRGRRGASGRSRGGRVLREMSMRASESGAGKQTRDPESRCRPVSQNSRRGDTRCGSCGHGFLQPHALAGTGKPHRLHGSKRRRGRSSRSTPRSASALLSKPKCSGEKRIGHALDTDRRSRPVTAVHGGRVGQGEELGWMLERSVAVSPPGRSVRPTDPLNSTSPLKTDPFPTKLTLPGECPGVNRTANSKLPDTKELPGLQFLLGRRRRLQLSSRTWRRTAAAHRK